MSHCNTLYRTSFRNSSPEQGSAIVQEIMRWEMVVVEESPWYQEIIAKGIERGREEGREEERRQSVQRILDIRFGPLAAAEVAEQVASTLPS
jgi:predicted transposase YdaD